MHESRFDGPAAQENEHSISRTVDVAALDRCVSTFHER